MLFPQQRAISTVSFDMNTSWRWKAVLFHTFIFKSHLPVLSRFIYLSQSDAGAVMSVSFWGGGGTNNQNNNNYDIW